MYWFFGKCAGNGIWGGLKGRGSAHDVGSGRRHNIKFRRVWEVSIDTNNGGYVVFSCVFVSMLNVWVMGSGVCWWVVDPLICFGYTSSMT